MTYKVIRSQSPDEFEKLVNDALKNGWHLKGGVSVIAVPTGQQGLSQMVYFQAITLGKPIEY